MSFSTNSPHPNLERYQNQCVVALDYGEKIIGLARFTPGRDPFPIGIGRILCQSPEYVEEQLKKILAEEEAQAIVLGLPTYHDGSDSKQTKKVRSFARKLEKLFPQLAVIFQDEHLSTFAAEGRMKAGPTEKSHKRMQKIDEMSAVIILEDFFGLS